MLPFAVEKRFQLAGRLDSDPTRLTEEFSFFRQGQEHELGP